ncbi:MAG: hypothetical protein QOC89_3488 [Paraburkholderia sp.]|nr:hypothetical protein [Paraburkholderia sp.]
MHIRAAGCVDRAFSAAPNARIRPGVMRTFPRRTRRLMRSISISPTRSTVSTDCGGLRTSNKVKVPRSLCRGITIHFALKWLFSLGGIRTSPAEFEHGLPVVVEKTGLRTLWHGGYRPPWRVLYGAGSGL